MCFPSSNSFELSNRDLVSFVLDHDNYDPTKPILIDALDPSKRINHGQARILVKRLIAGLRRQGLKQGETVCLHMMNSIMYPIFFLAIVGAGGRVTATNPAYTATELSHNLGLSSARFVITQQAYLPVVYDATRKNNIDYQDIVLYLDGASNETEHVSIERLLYYGKEDWIRFDNDHIASSTVASLATTSGTEGLPKLAMRSHYSLVNEALALEPAVKPLYEVKRLLCVPFFHAFAAPLVVVSAFRFGHETYVMPRFEQTTYLEAMYKYQITETAMPPPLILRFTMASPEERAALATLKRVLCGGAPLPIDIQNRALKMFAGDARIQQCYGMTEVGCIATFPSETDLTGSVGRLIAGTAKLIDENDQEVLDAGVLGEIFIRSPTTMLGYLGADTATCAMFDDEGYMRTGDIGYFTADGKLYIADRKKELIKVRAFQVAPHEIENGLLTFPGIMDAAVIGIPFEDGSEIPRAYIVCDANFDANEAGIKSHLLQSLSKYKVMDCQIRQVDSIPKSATGKILKRVLREMAKAEREG